MSEEKKITSEQLVEYTIETYRRALVKQIDLMQKKARNKSEKIAYRNILEFLK